MDEVTFSVSGATYDVIDAAAQATLRKFLGERYTFSYRLQIAPEHWDQDGTVRMWVGDVEAFVQEKGPS